MARVADALSEASGRPVAYEAETIEEAYASRATYGAPDWEVAGWVSSYAAIAAGELEVVSDTVERIVGHPPTDLRDWLVAHSEGLQHLRE
jgi:NAD(P)H dehydrogenase (quinone)